MRIKCVKVGDRLSSALFMWEAKDPLREGKMKKVIEQKSIGDEFEVEDVEGHGLIAKYPENFQVVSYGQTKVTSAPKRAMIEEEKTK